MRSKLMILATAFSLMLLGNATIANSNGGDPKIAATISDADSQPLGSQDNPVRVNMPQGEHAYLRQLRCSDGTAPLFERRGNVGLGVFGNVVDLYDVACPNGTPANSTIYMDMYHPQHDETRPVAGFTLVP